MKMNHKKGFSLAEILIALGIISIIATMGISIANKGVDRAYNLYYYSAYNAVASAFDSAEIEGQELGWDNSINGEEFIRSVLQSLSAENITSPNNSINKVSFSTPSSIKYSIERLIPPDANAINDEGVKIHSSKDLKHHGEYLIIADIPQRKTKNNSTNTLCLLYKVNSNPGGIIPVDTVVLKETGATVCSANVPFANRADLLPFYIDDGTVGRRIPIENGISDYKKRNHTSYPKAYCATYGGELEFAAIQNKIIKCSDYTGITSTVGAIVSANPKNI